MGETGAAAIYRLEDGRITELRRHRGRGSLGFLYGLITDLAGFDQVKGEEWKIMGLAPYGRPDPDLAALLARLCTVEGGRLRYRRRGDDPGGRRGDPRRAARRTPWRAAGPTSPAAARIFSRP